MAALLARLRELAALRHPTRPTRPRLASRPVPVKAHDRENLGLGGRRVLVSRQWSGKTLTEHKADRATVVREALLTSAGIVAPELDRIAATVTLPDGTPRFVWTDTRPDPDIYARVILASIAERQRWRAHTRQRRPAGPVDTLSATDRPP